ncbi:hypothetical protein AMTR_s00008p00055900 [Amborella trichopoda]|uniref:Uncharacterized protein n=1 Tax=Amborella trichopoda TaxID=13333 RepID=W1NJ78_AMBTC|nr:hypothetical protein AMTR_s00008p00055900 [Amborella trichopoda]
MHGAAMRRQLDLHFKLLLMALCLRDSSREIGLLSSQPLLVIAYHIKRPRLGPFSRSLAEIPLLSLTAPLEM